MLLGLTIAGRVSLSCLQLGVTGLLFVAARTSAQQLAFPGAEGFGAFTTGGRSGTVYHVTNLSNTGSGSFRDAVSAANRTIVFDVSGTIDLLSNLSINKSNLTIAGQTAPGDGIAIKGRLTSVQDTRNVIVRFIRCRPGDIGCTNSFQDDSFHVDKASNVIVDHVSASWSIDEALSVTGSTNVTVQWSVIAESLEYSCHKLDNGTCCEHHGYGSLLRYGAGGLSFHHNLYAHNGSRNPRLGDNLDLDFVNNVIYNWGGTAGYSGGASEGIPQMNYVNNYVIVGPSSGSAPFYAFEGGSANTQIYQSGNLMDTNKNSVLDGGDRGWNAFLAPYTQILSRFAFPQVTTDDATTAYLRVLSGVGASLMRDAADSRIISNVISQNVGAIIDSQNQVGGWPTLNTLPAPLDSDQDGMPDFWELALGSSTNNAADRNDLTPDGYTRLEGYLNWLAAPHARATNSFVDVELRQYTAGLQSPTYVVSSPTNGTVILLGDAQTARFTPTPSFSGLAGFLFTANGTPGSLTGTVSVLVSPSGALPPLTPFEQWQVNYFGSTNDLAADAAFDPDGDGQNNEAEFLSGTNPTNSVSALRIISTTQQGNDLAIAWKTAGGRTNAVQAAADTGSGYTNNFSDVSGPIIIPGSGDATTNHVDFGGASDGPSRYYRIRLVQ